MDALIRAHEETASWVDEARPEAVAFVGEQWGVSEERSRAALAALQGKIVARLDPADFRTVIEASAATLGLPPIAVEDLIAPRR